MGRAKPVCGALEARSSSFRRTRRTLAPDSAASVQPYKVDDIVQQAYDVHSAKNAIDQIDSGCGCGLATAGSIRRKRHPRELGRLAIC